MKNELIPLTYPMETAARLLGIGRNAAYQAAKRGEIPTLRIGRRLLVPKVALDLMLKSALNERSCA